MSSLCVFSLDSSLCSTLVSLLRSPCTLSDPHLLLDTRYYSAQIKIRAASSEHELSSLLQETEAVLVIPQQNNLELRAISEKPFGEDTIRLIISTKVKTDCINHFYLSH